MARTHGTISRYHHGGCRCDDCRRAAREERQRYRNRGRRCFACEHAYEEHGLNGCDCGCPVWEAARAEHAGR